jgi:hypothetical protein
VSSSNSSEIDEFNNWVAEDKSLCVVLFNWEDDDMAKVGIITKVITIEIIRKPILISIIYRLIISVLQI